MEPGMIPARLGLVLNIAGLAGHDVFKSITIFDRREAPQYYPEVRQTTGL